MLVGCLSDKSLIVKFTTWETVNIQQQFPVSNNNNVNEIMQSNSFSRKRAMKIQAYSNNVIITTMVETPANRHLKIN